LVVIKGVHYGTYVRRIHHQYEAGKPILRLAVVNREAGHMDKFTGEELELAADHLCVCDESEEDKELNKTLMKLLHEEARKTRVK